jgi:hypothetical protein
LTTHLKNAPVLRNLTLGTTNLKIRDMETIHAVAPNLEQLRLDGYEMWLEGFDL